MNASQISSSSDIDKSVQLGENNSIEAFCLLGHELRDKSHPPLKIGKNALIRSHSVLYSGSIIGTDFQTGHGILVRENCTIGNQVSIGSHSVLERDVIVEDYVRIHSNVFIPEKSILRHHSWIGPNVVFVNDPHPPCAGCMRGPTISEYAKIGANSTILDHITIGKNAIIAAGSVVIKDVLSGQIVGGNPAVPISTIKNLKCPIDTRLLKEYLQNHFDQELEK